MDPTQRSCNPDPHTLTSLSGSLSPHTLGLSLLVSPVLPLPVLCFVTPLLLPLSVSSLSVSLRVSVSSSPGRSIGIGHPDATAPSLAGARARLGAKPLMLRGQEAAGKASGFRLARDGKREGAEVSLPGLDRCRGGAGGGTWRRSGLPPAGSHLQEGRAPCLPPLTAEICRHLTAFPLPSDRN